MMIIYRHENVTSLHREKTNLDIVTVTVVVVVMMTTTEDKAVADIPVTYPCNLHPYKWEKRKTGARGGKQMLHRVFLRFVLFRGSPLQKPPVPICVIVATFLKCVHLAFLFDPLSVTNIHSHSMDHGRDPAMLPHQTMTIPRIWTL